MYVLFVPCVILDTYIVIYTRKPAVLLLYTVEEVVNIIKTKWKHLRCICPVQIGKYPVYYIISLCMDRINFSKFTGDSDIKHMAWIFLSMHIIVSMYMYVIRTVTSNNRASSQHSTDSHKIKIRR